MYGLTRGTTTLIGAGAAGLLIWLASQFDVDTTNGDYWAWVGLLAGAGLVMALSQLLGGWTKWGWPRVSAGVFLLGFLPALVVGGLMILHGQPDDGFGQGWAGDIGVDGLADDLMSVLPAIAFALGLVFGFTFDTTGPRVREVEDERVARRYDERVAEEPLTAERAAAGDRDVVTSDRRERATAGVAGAAAMPDRGVDTRDSVDTGDGRDTRDRVDTGDGQERAPAGIAGAGAVPRHDGDGDSSVSPREEPSRMRRFFGRR